MAFQAPPNIENTKRATQILFIFDNSVNSYSSNRDTNLRIIKIISNKIYFSVFK